MEYICQHFRVGKSGRLGRDGSGGGATTTTATATATATAAAAATAIAIATAASIPLYVQVCRRCLYW